jgi:3-hydroxybutyryl-CoA dehydrogenase
VSTARVAVIGAGIMGAGIAYVASAAGCAVALADTEEAALGRARDRIAESFARGVERGKLSADQRDRAMSGVRTVHRLEEAAHDAELVIEAVPERLPLKRALFSELDRIAPADALLATNTSSLSVTAIGEATRRPERVLGTHFFNPVPAMKLVEIVRGADTTDDSVERARRFVEQLGKVPIVVRDTPGFATSRLGVVLGLEAIRMLEQGVAAAEDIDRAMELGYNHPVGPLRLGDLVGLDVRLAVADHLHATLGGEMYRAPELLRQMVADGKLGRKSGEGFYVWSDHQ